MVPRLTGAVRGAQTAGACWARWFYWSARIAFTPAKRSSTSSRAALNSGSVLLVVGVVGVVSMRFPSAAVVVTGVSLTPWALVACLRALAYGWGSAVLLVVVAVGAGGWSRGWDS